MTPELVLDTSCLCGESPVWSADEEALYFTDNASFTMHRFHPASGRHDTWQVPENVCSFALREGGGMIAAMTSGFAFLELDAGKVDMIASPEAHKPDNRFNDGRCDRQGRFWAGTMNMRRSAADGSLYRLDGDSATPMANEVTVANGLAFSLDSKVMYWSDSPSSTVYAFDFDAATGAIENRRTFFKMTDEQGRPDGATIDAEGFYWSACFRGNRVMRIAPDGTVDREIMMPVRDNTMIAFGGPDLATLYITTSKEILSEEERRQNPLAGGLFAVDPGVRGVPEHKYRG